MPAALLEVPPVRFRDPRAEEFLAADVAVDVRRVPLGQLPPRTGHELQEASHRFVERLLLLGSPLPAGLVDDPLEPPRIVAEAPREPAPDSVLGCGRDVAVGADPRDVAVGEGPDERDRDEGADDTGRSGPE